MMSQAPQASSLEKRHTFHALQAQRCLTTRTELDIPIDVATVPGMMMVHEDIASGAVPLHQSWIGKEQLKNRLACVKMGPHHIPFAHPDKEPQKVLGVWVTPTLDWRHQQRRLMETAWEKSEAILESEASPKQKLAMIQSSLKPFVTYSFPLGVQSNQDIAELNNVISCTAVCGQILGLALRSRYRRGCEQGG